jgi:hypothetical protein
MINGVVVNERGQVHQLYQRGQRHSARMGPFTDAVGKQQQGWPKKFSPRPEEVIVHLFDDGEIRKHNSAELINNTIELRTHRPLYL